MKLCVETAAQMGPLTGEIQYSRRLPGRKPSDRNAAAAVPPRARAA